MKTNGKSEQMIKELAERLEIPESRYVSADRSYKSISAWLIREDSFFSNINVDVYTQGSFRLGTAIRPSSGEEHYDLDIVCEFKISKDALTQSQLQDKFDEEIKSYAKAHNMDDPSRWDRCWTLNYADSAQFHMDVLPSIPDGLAQRIILERNNITSPFIDRAVAITDKKHFNFSRKSIDWPVSNPNGYAQWFRSKMDPVFEMRRRAMMLAEAKANVAQIPDFRVKTPLQHAIQILKHHRNVRFSEAPDYKPSSIVLTTLAAHAYQQESSILQALVSVLTSMDRFIEKRGNIYWIPNPSDPRENFADRWQHEPQMKDAFFDWLETARVDFRSAVEKNDPAQFVEVLAPRMGRRIVEEATKKQAFLGASQGIVNQAETILRRLLDAPHKKPVVWPVVQSGIVTISAKYDRPGFRTASFTHNDRPLPKGSSLTFYADTNVPRPFKVYWQVVNTGNEAREAKMLRGGFEEVQVTKGNLTRKETTRFSGSHSIECFIVKEGFCVARSGTFVVNIQLVTI